MKQQPLRLSDEQYAEAVKIQESLKFTTLNKTIQFLIENYLENAWKLENVLSQNKALREMLDNMQSDRREIKKVFQKIMME
jgi:hypothetical protein